MRNWIKAIPLAILAMTAVTGTGKADGWSPWRLLTTADGVSLLVSTQTTDCGASVRFRAENNGWDVVEAAVQDKQFVCAGGGSERRSDELISGALAPGEGWTTIPDYCVCEGRNGVFGVNGSLVVR